MTIIAHYSLSQYMAQCTETGMPKTSYSLVMNEFNIIIKALNHRDALEKICAIHGLNVNDFVEKSHKLCIQDCFRADIIEPSNSPAGNKYISHYSIYIDLYKRLTPEECPALTQTKPGVE